MTQDEKYMQRCLQLAANGRGFVSPNPMVGAVVVHNGKIIGEGFHQQYGKAHAEVNAISKVKDRSLLRESTLYVSLEPCSHYGKTPPCSQLIIDCKIPKVVVACLDPFPAVSGRGIKMLREAGIEVIVHVSEAEALELNKEFITAQTKNRPYIYLKWAQTQDGFIDKIRVEGEVPTPTPISSDFTKMLVHKKRAEVEAIGIGTNTAINDNPSLTTRLWYGSNPTRIVLDRAGRIPRDYTIFNDNEVKTILFTEKSDGRTSSEHLEIVEISFDESLLENVFRKIKDKKINSIMIEGGRHLLQSLIDQNLWNEAFMEISNLRFSKGIEGPVIDGNIKNSYRYGGSTQLHLTNR